MQSNITNWSVRRPPALRVELLLIRLHVDTALELGAGGPDLKAGSAVGDRLVKLFQALDTGILHRVLETGGQVRHELADGTTVKCQ